MCSSDLFPSHDNTERVTLDCARATDDASKASTGTKFFFIHVSCQLIGITKENSIVQNELNQVSTLHRNSSHSLGHKNIGYRFHLPRNLGLRLSKNAFRPSSKSKLAAVNTCLCLTTSSRQLPDDISLIDSLVNCAAIGARSRTCKVRSLMLFSHDPAGNTAVRNPTCSRVSTGIVTGKQIGRAHV